MRLSVQILDLTTGFPADDVDVQLYRQRADDWDRMVETRTDVGGRVDRWGRVALGAGRYRLAVSAGRFYAGLGVVSAQEEVAVSFVARRGTENRHVFVLLAPFGHSACVTGTPS